MTVNQGTYALNEDATPRRVVLAFRGRYQFLSNFWPCNVTLPAEGELPALEFDSTEKAYMAWKTLNWETRTSIQSLKSGQAKRLTHLSDFPTRPDYSDAGRLTIMLELNRQKYSPRNPRLREQLLATGNAVLMEGNDWGDTFFGFDYNRGYGQNHLGRILMQVRAEIMEDIGAA